ncbi:hypothetical protein J5690_05805 [bacterium]|nr:hypothetical protein [bacterium]
MEKIIGGRELNCSFQMQLHSKILWPCYEFIAMAEGIDDSGGKNILEETILRFAGIKITDTQEIADSLCLDKDLVSFIQSRLEQKMCLDECLRITERGLKQLGEYLEKKPVNINIYVDAVSGRIIPYYTVIEKKEYFKYSYGHEDKDNCFYYTGYTTAGKESDEETAAYKLHYNFKFNEVPEGREVAAMLRKLFPGRDNISAFVDFDQNCGKNLRWFLLDIAQPKGAARNWIFSDGFGDFSSFFSVEAICHEEDSLYIRGLRDSLMTQTNAVADKKPESDTDFPKIEEKLQNVQRSMDILMQPVESSDSEEYFVSARNDAALYLAQLAEWTVYYCLHNGDNEYKAKETLEKLRENFGNNRQSGALIVKTAAKCARSSGFDFDEKNMPKESYSRLESAFYETPSLFAVLYLMLLSFEKEPKIKEFAESHPDFISALAELNKNRNNAFHSGEVESDEVFKELADRMYKEIVGLMEITLNITVASSSEQLSLKETIDAENERDLGVSRMEESLGFALSRKLPANITRFIIEMERRSPDEKSLDNAVVLSMYQILENIFVVLNNSLSDESKNSDWQKKALSCGFEFDKENSCFKSILKTEKQRIKNAVERKTSTMNAACIAFLILADTELLRSISSSWRTMLRDVSYIAGKRAHGEVPDEIDSGQVMEIKDKIYVFIKDLAKNGFFTQKNVNYGRF